MIRFDAFSWRFSGSTSWALHDVSLHIRPGEFVAIAGPSGSGKSTLGLAMCGLLVGRDAGEAQGKVYASGRDVAATPLHRTARTIGLVQQNPETHFATLTVHDEIAFGMENRCLPLDKIHRRSAEAFELLSIAHLRDRDLSTLSGGEKQRVAIASIVAGKPKALVLDEPSSSLDPQASQDLFRYLAKLCRETGLTVVIIEHKLAHLLPHRPRLIHLNAGRVEVDDPSATAEQLPAGHATVAWSGRTEDGMLGATTGGGDVVFDMTDVTVEYDGHTVLDNVSLRVHPGEVVAVMGPNGGGKSTLLLSLLGLAQPVKGSITVCGIKVARNAISRLAGDVGVVFQNADHQLVADTVWSEALFTSRNVHASDSLDEQGATRMLESARLSPRRDAHPYRLSWGEKRRLNLISAVLHRPRLLLLDEPFAGQDWENITFQLDTIHDVLKGDCRSCHTGTNASSQEARGACLMVTHDPRAVLRSCTRLLFVSAGRVTVDAPMPQALDLLLQMGLDAYVPAACYDLRPADPEATSSSAGPFPAG